MPLFSRSSSSLKQRQRLSDGRIVPSDHAFVDVFHYTESGEMDLTQASIHTDQEQRFCNLTQTFNFQFKHRLLYKGDTIWELSNTTQAGPDGLAVCPSECKISKGRLQVKLYKSNPFLGKKEWKIVKEKKVYDIIAIIIGSAAAYQIEATEEEYGLLPFLPLQRLESLRLEATVSALDESVQPSIVSKKDEGHETDSTVSTKLDGNEVAPKEDGDQKTNSRATEVTAVVRTSGAAPYEVSREIIHDQMAPISSIVCSESGSLIRDEGPGFEMVCGDS